MVDLQRRIQDFLFIRGRITFFGEKIFSSGAESQNILPLGHNIIPALYLIITKEKLVLANTPPPHKTFYLLGTNHTF